MNLGYHGRIVRNKSGRQTRARYKSIEGLEKNSAQGVSNLRNRDVRKAPLGENIGRLDLSHFLNPPQNLEQYFQWTCGSQ